MGGCKGRPSSGVHDGEDAKAGCAAVGGSAGAGAGAATSMLDRPISEVGGSCLGFDLIMIDSDGLIGQVRSNFMARAPKIAFGFPQKEKEGRAARSMGRRSVTARTAAAAEEWAKEGARQGAARALQPAVGPQRVHRASSGSPACSLVRLVPRSEIVPRERPGVARSASPETLRAEIL